MSLSQEVPSPTPLKSPPTRPNPEIPRHKPLTVPPDIDPPAEPLPEPDIDIPGAPQTEPEPAYAKLCASDVFKSIDAYFAD